MKTMSAVKKRCEGCKVCLASVSLVCAGFIHGGSFHRLACRRAGARAEARANR